MLVIDPDVKRRVVGLPEFVGAGRLEALDVGRSDGFGWVRIALDVALRAMAEAAFELVGVSAGGAGELEGEGMAHQTVRLSTVAGAVSGTRATGPFSLS